MNRNIGPLSLALALAAVALSQPAPGEVLIERTTSSPFKNVCGDSSTLAVTSQSIIVTDANFNAVVLEMGDDNFTRNPDLSAAALTPNRQYIPVGNGGLVEFNGSGASALVWDPNTKEWQRVSPNPLASVFNSPDFKVGRGDFDHDGSTDALFQHPIPGAPMQLVKFDCLLKLFSVDTDAVPIISLQPGEFLTGLTPCEDMEFYSKRATSGPNAGTERVRVRRLIKGGGRVDEIAPGALGRETFEPIYQLCVYKTPSGASRVAVATFVDPSPMYVRVFDCLSGDEIPESLELPAPRPGLSRFECRKTDGTIIVEKATANGPLSIVTRPRESGGRIEWVGGALGSLTPNAFGFGPPIGQAVIEVDGEDKDVFIWDNGNGRVEMTSEESGVFRPAITEVFNPDGSPGGRVVGEHFATGDFNGDDLDDIAALRTTFEGTKLRFWKGDGRGRLFEQDLLNQPNLGINSSIARFDTRRHGSGPVTEIVVSDPDSDPTFLQIRGDTLATIPPAEVYSDPATSSPGIVETADFDGDGLDDILRAPLGETASVALSGPDGRLGPTMPIPGLVSSGNVSPTDYDGDGLDDVVTGQVGAPTRAFKSYIDNDGNWRTIEDPDPNPLGTEFDSSIYDGVFAHDFGGDGYLDYLQWIAVDGLASSRHCARAFTVIPPPDSDQDGIPDAADPRPEEPNSYFDYLDYVCGFTIGSGDGFRIIPSITLDPLTGEIEMLWVLGPEPVTHLIKLESSFKYGLQRSGDPAPLQSWYDVADLSNSQTFVAPSCLKFFVGRTRREYHPRGYARLAVRPGSRQP